MNRRRDPWPSCCICGEPKSAKYGGKYYCNKHYQSMLRYGQPFGHPRERTNSYDVDGDILVVRTNKGDEILVDLEEADKVKRHSWCVSVTGYAVANIGKKVVKLHGYILDAEDGTTIDHINRNKLDNRKSNLRFCTTSENMRNCANTKGSVVNELGISMTAEGRYRARIMLNRKEINLGHYDTLEEAVQARIQGEQKYFGEFAPIR